MSRIEMNTPTPWKIVDRFNELAIVGADGTEVAVLTWPDGLYPEDGDTVIDNATLIVEKVNR